MNFIDEHGWIIHDDRLNKVALIVLYLIVNTWLLILLRTAPTRGYEISIYGAYPPFFWFLCILTIVLSFSYTFYFLLNGAKFWKYSLLIIPIINIVVIFLPLIRGYEIFARGGYDIFTHFASSNIILNSGYTQGSDLYPAMHILIAILDQIGIHNIGTLSSIISACFYIFYIISLYTLGKATLKDKKSAIFISLFGTPLLFSVAHYAFYPFSFALFLFPLVFACVQKLNDPENASMYYICLTVLSLFVVFCHPLVSVILFFSLGALFGFSIVGNKYQIGFVPRFDILNITTIVGITFVFWYIRFTLIQQMSETVYSALIGNSESGTVMSSSIDLVNRSSAPLLTLVEAFLKIYGPLLLYILIALCITIHFIKKYWVKKEYPYEMVYGFLFFLSIIVGIILTLGPFIIAEFFRSISFAIIMATIMCGMGLNILIKDAGTPKRKQICFAIIAVTILSLVGALTVFNLYYSPFIYSPGMYMTQSEKSGDDWYLMHNEAYIPIFSEGNPIHKYALFFQEKQKTNIQMGSQILDGVPTHFGYDKNRYFNQSIGGYGEKQSYLVTNELMIENYLAYPAEMQLTRKQFLPEDFIRLNLDTTVMKIYSNHGSELWIA